MIKNIRKSLTIKICILMAVLLAASSGITYAVIIRFLPTYYSEQLQKDLDIVSREMTETLSSYETIEEASYEIELFEAGPKVSVVILDKQGIPVWPAEEGIAVENADVDDTVEDTFVKGVEQEGSYEGGIAQDEIAIEAGSQLEKEAEENSTMKRYNITVGEQNYTMLVSGGMQPVNQSLEILHQILPYILGITAIVSIIFALGASFYLTLPIIRLSQLSKRMAQLDFTNVYQGTRSDEIGILGKNLNELSQNLSRALRELKDTNKKLKWDIEREREIEKKRIAFFSAVSHELKTPITILKGHLSGMLQGIGEYRNRDYYLKRSQETVEKMEDMVKELLTVSRIERKNFVTKKTDVAEQIRQQLAEMTELIENKKLSLSVDLPEHLSAEVNPEMMEKVFSNLLLNAIRYTPEGDKNQIKITMKKGSNPGHFDFQIENTGVYIPEDALPHLFEAFYRVEQSRNRQTGGSGLGLYIVKMILDQHGARYDMKNTSAGVLFSFCL